MAELLQPGTATGIGSLPFTDPDRAAAWVFERHAELPYAPQLPRRSANETLLGQAAVGIRGVTVGRDGSLRVDIKRLDPLAPTRTDLEHDAFAGFRAFLRAGAGRADAVKWQLAGPITLGLALVQAGAPAADAFDVAVRAVRTRLRIMREAVSEAMPAAPQLVFLDEPSLVTLMCPGFPLPPDAAVDLVSGALAAIDRHTVAGVHCCGDADWPAVISAGPTVLSLPVSASVVNVAGYLAGFLEHGGWIAWGAVPTDRPLGSSADHWWRELSALWCSLVQAGCDPVLLRTRALITPACGLASHDESQADLIADLAGDIAGRVRAQATATRLNVGA
jgi:hypothetical protein